MPAHLKQIRRPICGYPGCPRWAGYELWNTRNALVASYCGNHAKRMLREHQAAVGEVTEGAGSDG